MRNMHGAAKVHVRLAVGVWLITVVLAGVQQPVTDSVEMYQPKRMSWVSSFENISHNTHGSSGVVEANSFIHYCSYSVHSSTVI